MRNMVRWPRYAVIALAVGIGMAVSGAVAAVYQWSQTPSSNASADPTINFREGQAPSSLNDSARAMMAALAKYRDDIAGTNVTSGSSTAYTLSTNSGYDTLAHLNGQAIAFTPHTTNGAVVTLAVDGLTARPLRSSPGVELGAGALIQGTPYVAVYNNTDTAFYLVGFFGNSFNVPIGGGIFYLSSTPPNSNFVLPAGQAISRTTYAALFSLISTTFGPGNGTSTFNIPDLRGSVIAGLDNMGGTPKNLIGTVVTDNGTIVGTTLGSAGGSATHAQTLSELAQHSHTINDPGHNHSSGNGFGIVTVSGGPGTFAAGANGGSVSPIGSNTTGITINNNGSSSPMSLLPPTVMLYYLLRII